MIRAVVAAAIPGVEDQQSTFNQIIGVTVAIAAVVIALFFALLTVERAALYGVLKALGARSSTIFAGLIAQAVTITVTNHNRPPTAENQQVQVREGDRVTVTLTGSDPDGDGLSFTVPSPPPAMKLR